MRQIPEKDWKVLRKLKDGLLQNFCNEALAKLEPIVVNPGPDAHKAYLQLWKVLNKEDKELSLLFDELKRSTAFYKLAAWRSHGLLSDKDFDQFSEETKEVVDFLTSV